MAKLCGSSEAAETLCTALKTTLQELINEYSAICQAFSNLEDCCHDENLDVAEYFKNELYKQLCEIMQEAAKAEQSLKKYSLFVQSLDSKFYRDNDGNVPEAGKKRAASPSSTSQLWHREADGSYTFDSPQILAEKLDIRQGKSGLNGSCGLCSVENVIIIFGVRVTVDDIYSKAYKTGLCSRGGGTTWQNREEILRKYSIGSHPEKQTIDNIAAAINSGRVAILSVDANKLYHRWGLWKSYHAVIVTSISVDENANVTEITVCDSNAFRRGETGAKRYKVEELERALTGRPMNVTDAIR